MNSMCFTKDNMENIYKQMNERMTNENSIAEESMSERERLNNMSINTATGNAMVQEAAKACLVSSNKYGSIAAALTRQQIEDKGRESLMEDLKKVIEEDMETVQKQFNGLAYPHLGMKETNIFDKHWNEMEVFGRRYRRDECEFGYEPFSSNPHYDWWNYDVLELPSSLNKNLKAWDGQPETLTYIKTVPMFPKFIRVTRKETEYFEDNSAKHDLDELKKKWRDEGKEQFVSDLEDAFDFSLSHSVVASKQLHFNVRDAKFLVVSYFFDYMAGLQYHVDDAFPYKNAKISGIRNSASGFGFKPLKFATAEFIVDPNVPKDQIYFIDKNKVLTNPETSAVIKNLANEMNSFVYKTHSNQPMTIHDYIESLS